MLRRYTAVAVALIALLFCAGLIVHRQDGLTHSTGDAASAAAHPLGPEAGPDGAPRALANR